MIPGTFAIVGGGALKSVVFQEARHSSTNTNSFTFTNVNLGYPDPTRLIVVGVSYYEFDTSVVLNSVIVDGGTATSRVTDSENVPGGSGSFIYANISTRSVATGTTASITANFSRSIDRGCSISVWSVYGLNSSTPVATARQGVSSGAATISFTTQAEDVIIGVLTGAQSSGATTWSGLTEDYDTSLNSLTRSGASRQVYTAGSLTVTGQNTSGETVLVGAQWR